MVDQRHKYGLAIPVRNLKKKHFKATAEFARKPIMRSKLYGVTEEQEAQLIKDLEAILERARKETT